ncbi:MFS transporter [Amycolatopsis sp. cmx-4-83]|uniref:MFS transporter n=1 Tax=Amycolatopsis sp. cmx-4-83 TaxID=2790940 RepID=UPI00397C77F4
MTEIVTKTTTVRTRAMGVLFTGAAALNTAVTGATTVSTLIASDSHGDGWSGIPNAAVVAGTAFGALYLGVLIGKKGARTSLKLVYGVAAFGGLVAFLGGVFGNLLLLLPGLALLGIGNGAAGLVRYTAAELYPDNRKGFALSLIVWAGTIGAIAGPALLEPAATTAGFFGLPSTSGAIGFAALLCTIALLASATMPKAAFPAQGPQRPPLTFARVAAALKRRVVLVPLVSMTAAHVTMVTVMTMTPLQLHRQGHGLEVVGYVLSAHMIGMFALAPLSGKIADRIGGRATITAGVGVLVLAAVTVIAAPTSHTAGLPLALFLLGYGWNLVFVGSSALLSRSLEDAERTQLQGVIDALVWSASGLGGIIAGGLFGLGGYALVAGVAAVLALTPLTLVARRG